MIIKEWTKNQRKWKKKLYPYFVFFVYPLIINEIATILVTKLLHSEKKFEKITRSIIKNELIKYKIIYTECPTMN